MGRKASRWAHLPKGMRARPRGEKVWYYLDTGGKPRREIPLGCDYVLAVQEWARLEAEKRPPAAEGTFPYVAELYRRQVLPTKAVRTRIDNEKELVWLLKFFGTPPAPLNQIEPAHVRRYIMWRMEQSRAGELERRPDSSPPANFGHVRANREKALFSHIFNFARELGYTSAPNPAAGVKGAKETGRDVYVDDDLFARVCATADQATRFALRFAHLIGQRPADVLGVQLADIQEGHLHIQQGKTRMRLRIRIEGELAALLDEIAAWTAHLKFRAPCLLVDERGREMTVSKLRSRFDAAREAAGVDKALFQFRDLRAKAGTEASDTGGMDTAQALLGHTTQAMTARYVRHKRGKIVGPLR